MTSPDQITGASGTPILANNQAARQAAVELLTAAREEKLVVVTLPDTNGVAVYLRTPDGTYARLTDDHVRLAAVLAGGRLPLLGPRRIRTPIGLENDGQDKDNYRLETTAVGDAALRSKSPVCLPPVYEIRAIRTQEAVLVR